MEAEIYTRGMLQCVWSLVRKLELTGGRFGQLAIPTCSYCSLTANCTILVLSGILLDHLRTATLLLLLTTSP